MRRTEFLSQSSRRDQSAGAEENGRRRTLVRCELGAASGAVGLARQGRGDPGWARIDLEGVEKEPEVPTEHTEYTEEFEQEGTERTEEGRLTED